MIKSLNTENKLINNNYVHHLKIIMIQVEWKHICSSFPIFKIMG